MKTSAQRDGSAADRATARPAPAAPTGGRPPTARILLRLQRSAGNRAVAGLVARARRQATPATAVRVQRVAVQRSPVAVQRESAADLVDKHSGVLGLDEEELGQELAGRMPGEAALASQVLDTLSSSDRDDVAYELVRSLSGGQLAGLPDDLRIRCIREMVYGWVTDEEEGEISRLWQSFGERLPDVAAANLELWKKSVHESDQLNELPQITAIREAFGRDVVDLARRYLADNEKGVVNEAKRLGVNLRGDAGGAAPEAEPGYVDGIRAVGAQVMELQKLVKALTKIQVGYSVDYDPESGMEAGESPAYFNPESQPDRAPKGNEAPPLASWEATKAQHDRVTAVIRNFANLYPSIFVLIQQEKLEGLGKAGSSAQATAIIEDSLRQSLGKIDETKGMVDSGDISYFDLIPVQQQLFAGAPAVSFTPQHQWQQPFYQALAKDVLADHESREFWVSLGLSLVAAAALIAAPFTGGASAAILIGVGLGIGAGQAAVSWERYADLSTAAKANVRDDLALIGDGQVTAALITAIIDTVAVFIDAYTAGSATATQQATRRAAFEVADKELREQMLREARRRAARGATGEAAATVAGAGVAVGAHELFDEEPTGSVTVEERAIAVPDAPAGDASSVSRIVVQRNGPILTGEEFEQFVERAIRRNEIGGLPPMDFIMPGQYNGSGWGMDRIGISIDEATGEVRAYHFEMKFQVQPELGRPGAGTQTGLAWTDNAIEGLLTSQHAKARAVRERLRRALQSMHPGEYIDINRMREFLELRISKAPVRIIVPNFADLSRLYKQIAGLRRWGRDVGVIRVHVP
jgi:hypothetical protein